MGNAKARGTYAERQAQALKAGRVKANHMPVRTVAGRQISEAIRRLTAVDRLRGREGR